MTRRTTGAALRIIGMGAIVTTLFLMQVEPDLRHQYVLGSIRVTRYALTQSLLCVFIVAEVAALLVEWRSRYRSAPKGRMGTRRPPHRR